MTGGILVVDDIATNRVVLKVRLEQTFRRTIVAEDGAGCLRQVHANRPDLILLDLNLPDMSGIDVLNRLRTDPATRRIPVIVISASTDGDQRLAALAAGAEDFMAKPHDDRVLQARIRNLLRWKEDLHEDALPLMGLAEGGESYAPQGRIALVFGKAEAETSLRRRLGQSGLGCLTTLSHRGALEIGDETGADLFVVDADHGTAEGGLRLVSELRSRAETRHAGICLWLPDSGPRPDTVVRAFDLGVDDVVTGAMPDAEVAVRLSGVLRRRQDAGQTRQNLRDRARLAAVDPLTGLWNRRYAIPQVGAMIRQAALAGEPVVALLFDLDHFKRVNDAYGHAAGDAVLREFAQHISAALPDAMLARIGGDEFIAALPAGRLSAEAPARKDPFGCWRDIRHIAQDIGQRIMQAPVRLPDGTPLSVTASIGLALATPDDTAETLIDRADRALYASKAGGRNRVTLADCTA